MSFAAPLGLLALLVIPLAALLYGRRRGRARRFAVRFPAASTLLLAAPAVPAWRRHLPAALAIAAMVPLALALAKPQVSVSVPIDRASIVLVTDHSGSMNATDVAPDRLTAAQKAANSFIDELPARVRLGVVTYAGGVDAVQSPDTDHELSRRVIAGQTADGATATGDALASALELLARGAKGAPSAIVLLSDGKTTTGAEPVAIAQQDGAAKKIPIYTVALGTNGAILQNPDPFGPDIDVSPDAETLRQIADVSGGQAFTADDSGNLEGIYEKLGSRLGTRMVKRERTVVFALAGLALLLAAGGAAQRRPLRLA
ncbi:MAG: VWA domain-containing protein [Solirubrobacteraceae bacterium]